MREKNHDEYEVTTKYLYYTIHKRAKGLFWVMPLEGNRYEEGVIHIIERCPLDEAYYTSGGGRDYTIAPRPQTIRIMARDLTTGKIITSNVIDIP